MCLLNSPSLQMNFKSLKLLKISNARITIYFRLNCEEVSKVLSYIFSKELKANKQIGQQGLMSSFSTHGICCPHIDVAQVNP